MKIKELEKIVNDEKVDVYGQVGIEDLFSLIKDQNQLLLAILKKLNKITNLVSIIEHYTD